MIYDLDLIPYFGSFLTPFSSILRGLFDLVFYRLKFKPDPNLTSSSPCSLTQQPPPGATTVPWPCCFSPFPVNRWALLLPLAMPTYIIAYAYLDVLHPVGPLQTFIRDLASITNPQDLRLPDPRSMGAASC